MNETEVVIMMPKAMPSMPVPGGGAPMPNNPMPAGAPPAAAGAGGGESNTPQQVRAAIMSVLQRAKALAEQYGLDINEIVAELGAGGSRPATPPPPARESMMPMGGGEIPPTMME